ncbi:MAG: FHA domain-containing protein, partial [Blastocatellia bacterium]
MKVVEVNNEVDLVQDSSNNHSNTSININYVNNIAAIKMDKVDELETDLLVDSEKVNEANKANEVNEPINDLLEANQLERNQLNSIDGGSDNNNGSASVSNSIVALVADVVGIDKLENNLVSNFSDNFDGKSNKNTSIQLEGNLERSISPYQLKMLDKTYVLYEGENKIGRATSNTIFVDNEFVSRNHATINVDGDSLTIIDYSKNGTFVNGCRIFQPTELSINDTIFITKGYKYELVQNDIAKAPLVKRDVVESDVVNDELVEADVIKSEPAKSVENELVISGLVAETELVQRLSRFNSLGSRLGSSSNSNRF